MDPGAAPFVPGRPRPRQSTRSAPAPQPSPRPGGSEPCNTAVEPDPAQDADYALALHLSEIELQRGSKQPHKIYVVPTGAGEVELRPAAPRQRRRRSRRRQPHPRDPRPPLSRPDDGSGTFEAQDAENTPEAGPKATQQSVEDDCCVWRAWLPLARSCAPALDHGSLPAAAVENPRRGGLHGHPVVRAALQRPAPPPPLAQLAALASSPYRPPLGPAAPDATPSCLSHHLRHLPSAETEAAAAALRGSTPLAVVAAFAGPTATAAAHDLLAAGADPARPVPASGLTPLHIATAANEETAAALLEARGQQGPGARSGLRCGHCRCCARGVGSARRKVDSLPSRRRRWQKAHAAELLARAATPAGYTVMHSAAAAGSVRMIRALSSLGADAGAATAEGATPAHAAAAHGRPDSLRALASVCAMRDPAATPTTWTPLGLACICGQPAAAAEAVRMGDLPLDTCGPYGTKAPELAVLAPPTKCGEVLAALGHAAASTMTARSSVLPLAVCVRGGALSTVLARHAAARGATCGRSGPGGRKDLQLAAYRLPRSTANRLRELCGERGRQAVAGDSLLTLAARVGTANTVRLLLREGADPGTTAAGATPLGHAIARWAVHASRAFPSVNERVFTLYRDVAIPLSSAQLSTPTPAQAGEAPLQEASAVVLALARAGGSESPHGPCTDAAGRAFSVLQRQHFNAAAEGSISVQVVPLASSPPRHPCSSH